MRKTRRLVPLNPYIALSDVMINLLLIMTAYLLVSASATDAYYASQEKRLEKLFQKTFWKQQCHFFQRQGRNIEFRIKTGKLFVEEKTELTKTGGDILNSLAQFLKNPDVSNLYTHVRVTVNQTLKADPRLAPSRADVIRKQLVKQGLKKQIVAAGRTQIRTDEEANEVSIVLELDKPQD
jgi:outer membrane protein OmpA-like peptidoglycan-associated protein